MKRWLLLCVFCAGLAQAQTYRWVDDQGKVHYGDRPPASAAGKAEARRYGDPAGSQQLPYATRQAMTSFPVTLYVSKDCGEACKEGGALLKRRAVPFTEKSVESQEDIDALKKLTGDQPGVPVLQVGTKVRKGFEEGGWNSLLDAAGYPKAP